MSAAANNKDHIRCPRCNLELNTANRFCSSCGKKIKISKSKPQLSWRFLLSTLVLASVLWISVWPIMKSLNGNKPRLSISTSENTQNSDPMNQSAHFDSDQLPDNPEQLLNMARALKEKLKDPQQATGDQIMQAIATYKKLTDIDPKNSEAFLALADISFAFGVLDKSLEYYKKYLSLKPQDQAVRTQYGHSLLLAEEIDESIKELKAVVNTDPKATYAWIYLAIAYTKLNDQDNAATAKDKALSSMNTDSERAELKDFFDKLKKQN